MFNGFELPIRIDLQLDIPGVSEWDERIHPVWATSKENHWQGPNNLFELQGQFRTER